ncbi:MAG: histidine phosphatase family protein, partial [Burkholderiaceae bacterium]
MDLILWRHAEAEVGTEHMNDLARPLTARGEKQAARMAAWLDRQLPDGLRVLSSP